MSKKNTPAVEPVAPSDALSTPHESAITPPQTPDDAFKAEMAEAKAKAKETEGPVYVNVLYRGKGMSVNKEATITCKPGEKFDLGVIIADVRQKEGLPDNWDMEVLGVSL